MQPMPQVEITTRQGGDFTEITGLRIDGHDVLLPADSEIRVVHHAHSPTIVSIDVFAGSVEYVPEIERAAVGQKVG